MAKQAQDTGGNDHGYRFKAQKEGKYSTQYELIDKDGPSITDCSRTMSILFLGISACDNCVRSMGGFQGWFVTSFGGVVDGATFPAGVTAGDPIGKTN